MKHKKKPPTANPEPPHLQQLELRVAELTTINNILKSQLREITLLYNFSRRITTVHKADELIKILKEFLQTHFVITEFALILPDESHRFLQVRYSAGLPKQKLREVFYRPGQGYVGRAFQENQFFYVPDARKEPGYRYFHFRERVGGSVLFVPLRLPDSQPIGVLKMRNPVANAFEEDELNILQHLAEHVAATLHTCNLLEILNKETLMDSETGFPNRRLFEKIYLREVSRAQRYQHSLSLIGIQVQQKRFRITASPGPLSWETIQQVAKALLPVLRDTDFIARWDEQTFLALLPETGSMGRQRVEEKLLHLLQQMENQYLDQKKDFEFLFQVTGCTFPRDGIEPQELLNNLLAGIALTDSGARG